MQKLYTVNCLLLGDSDVGKASIIRRLMKKKFEEKKLFLQVVLIIIFSHKLILKIKKIIQK